MSTIPANLKRKASPFFYWGIGILFGGFFIMGILAQIATTQAALLGGGKVDFFRPDWEILLQVPRMVGLLPPPFSAKEGSAVMMAWFISLVYVGCVVGNEIYDDAKHNKGVIFTNLFRIGLGCMIMFDFWTDLQYGADVFGWGGSAWLFAIIVGFMVAFSGIIGVDFIEKGFKAL